MFLKNPLQEANTTYKKDANFETKISNELISANPLFNNEWVIYPNPSNGLFKISPHEIGTDSQIKIYNPSGQLMKTVDNIKSKEIELNLSDYPTGIYVVTLKNSKGIQYKKIQKVK